jgi:hypothetical protein
MSIEPTFCLYRDEGVIQSDTEDAWYFPLSGDQGNRDAQGWYGIVVVCVMVMELFKTLQRRHIIGSDQRIKDSLLLNWTLANASRKARALPRISRKRSSTSSCPLIKTYFRQTIQG